LDKEIVERYINKHVLIFLKNGFRYDGYVIHVGKDSFVIRDKNETEVALSFDQIETIKFGGDSP